MNVLLLLAINLIAIKAADNFANLVTDKYWDLNIIIEGELEASDTQSLQVCLKCKIKIIYAFY